jgi:hypothetical protein
VRLSFHLFNGEEDVELAATALRPATGSRESL